MNTSNHIILSCMLALSLPSGAESPDSPETDAAREARLLQKVEEYANQPPAVAIPKLGEWVRKLSRPASMEREPRPVFHAAREALLSIPGHAEFFASKIKEITEQEIERTATEHPLQRAWEFETLSHLQSPETVKVLGEFLFDERDPWDTDGWGDGGRPYANSVHAVEALHTLGLHNAPVKGKFASPEKDLRTWQLWFEQVRAGNRTFSFEGDDTIYSLAGPVSEAREPVAPLGERSRNPAAGSAAATGSGRKLWPGIAAAILAIIAILMAARNFRRSAA